MDRTVFNCNLIAIPYDAIQAARRGKPFNMCLGRTEAAWVIAAVNQGIDSYLEACNMPDRGDSYVQGGGKLVCTVSPESLPTLLRRLNELDPETLGCTDSTGEPMGLTDSILNSIGFDEYGNFVEEDED